MEALFCEVCTCLLPALRDEALRHSCRHFESRLGEAVQGVRSARWPLDCFGQTASQCLLWLILSNNDFHAAVLGFAHALGGGHQRMCFAKAVDIDSGLWHAIAHQLSGDGLRATHG